MESVRELEALFILKDAYNDKMILKSMPQKLVKVERRLTNRLTKLIGKMVRQAYYNPSYNAHDIEAPVRTLLASHIPTVMQISKDDLFRTPKIRFNQELINPDFMRDIMDKRIFNASEATINRLTGDVLTSIKDGVIEGRSYDKTALELSKDFQDMKKYEMKRIARTETHIAYNENKYEMLKQMEFDGGKRWNTSGLSTVRPWHQDIDGEVVHIDETFSNGLMYPGDPDGDAEEIINCACNFSPVIRYQQESLGGET